MLEQRDRAMAGGRAAAHGGARVPSERLRVGLIVTAPAGPSNRYRIDPRTNAVVLAGVEPDTPPAPVERGRLAGTLGDDGRPLAAVTPVRWPTFVGCVIPVHPVGLVRVPGRAAPLVVGVPAVDPVLARARAIAELPEAARAAVLAEAAGGELGDAAAAEAAVRVGIEAELRARAAARQGRGTVPAWKTADARPPVVDGCEAPPHTFAEQAVPLLPARFQEYIARALLPEERILMFIHRPALAMGGGLSLRRRKLREGIFVLTDRQVMFMVDSLEPGSMLVHWGYIARVGAVERVAAAEVRQDGQLMALNVTFAAARGAETVSFAFPPDFAEAVAKAAALLRGFVPTAGSRAVRRRYARAVPEALPSLAEVRGPAGASGAALSPSVGSGRSEGGRPGPETSGGWGTGRVPPVQTGVPDWARALLPDESVLAWAQAPAEREPPATLVVGERSVVVQGAGHRGRGPEHIDLDDLTSAEMTLSLIRSGLELAVGAGEGVRRPGVTFHYPAAPPFLGAFTVIRHLMGLPPAPRGTPSTGG
jgi:inorganic pyrophosphatase